ncbi:cytochrome P450 [Talaromyces proteolyticus]|uniref:Cytochrome P450 n=1 Tax=Talaromyces proteolyticus TaxID=1131652 RepID=A0AAD4KUH4_9EURO|nr:cytochrome P450 [Talaromyces proteolyticus]KAH8700216.1 cytochrome P450 [Talaromyces proteolyticus]
MLALIVALTLVFGALFAHILYQCHLHPLAAYPGPWLARVTNFWRLATFLSGDHHLRELELHRRYGRIVRVGPNWLSFSNLADFEAIYGFNHHIEKDDFYNFGRGSKGTSSLFTAQTTSQHRERRKKVVTPALTHAKVAGYADVVHKHAAVLLTRVEELNLQSTSEGDERQPINIARTLHRYTIDAALEIIYGPVVCPEPLTDMPATAGFPEAIKKVTKMAWAASLVPAIGRLMSTRPIMALVGRMEGMGQTAKATAVPAVASMSAKLIFSQRELISKSQQNSILKHWVDLPSEDSRKMAPPELWSDTFNLVLAGTGSTAAALTALIYRLGLGAGKPWQAKIHAEIEAGGEGLPSSSSFPTLFAVIKETLRLDAPFPTAFPRTIRPGAETAIPNLPTALPAGTMVSANTFVLGRSRTIWGEDAEEWKPQRWLGTSNAEEQQELEDRFVAFSKGSRQCVGKDLALLMVASAASAVIRKWDFSSVGQLKGGSFLEMSYEECWISLDEV